MLIVNPNNGIPSGLAAREPPLWAGLTASYYHADILDAEAENLTLEQTEAKIRQSGHKDVLIVVMGNNPSVSSTPKMPVSEALASRLEGLEVRLTGIHPMAVGSRYPVLKECFRGFPMMPWNKLPMDKYRAHFWHCLGGLPREGYASIYTSLGCPFNCYYCNIHTLYPKHRVEVRPVKDIAEEVAKLPAYGVRNIKIWDELFAMGESRVLDVCSVLEPYHFNIWAYARLDTVTPRMLKAMKQGGINWVAYGFESVADKKFIKRTDEVIRMTRDAGINIIANFMFGAPGTTKDDDMRSLEFALKHLFEFVNFYDAKPYPGSKWYADLKQKDSNWSGFNQYGGVSPFRRQALLDYFTDPDYLSMVRKKFGDAGLVEISKSLEWVKV